MAPRFVVLACLAALAFPAQAGAVIGGSPASAQDAPWATALVRHTARSARAGQFCAGSVIAPTVVLTAAHCVDDRQPGQVDAVTGRTRLSSAAVGQRIPVAAISISPDWNPSGQRHDVALVTLAAPTSSPPLGIAGPANGTLVRPGVELLASGWGRREEAAGTGSDDLQKATLFVDPQDNCDRIYRSFDITRNLCASAHSGPVATCRGDSGGAVVGFDGPTPVIVGLVSFGTSHCADGNPRAYARVPAEAGWIAAHAGLPAPAEPVAADPRITRAKCRPGRCAVNVVFGGDDSSVGGVSVRVGGVSSPFEALPSGPGWRADFALQGPTRRVSAQGLDAASQPLGPAARASVR